MCVLKRTDFYNALEKKCFQGDEQVNPQGKFTDNKASKQTGYWADQKGCFGRKGRWRGMKSLSD